MVPLLGRVDLSSLSVFDSVCNSSMLSSFNPFWLWRAVVWRAVLMRIKSGAVAGVGSEMSLFLMVWTSDWEKGASFKGKKYLEASAILIIFSEEFSGELAHIDPIQELRKADIDLERNPFVGILLYDNQNSPQNRLDSHMEEIDLFLATNDSMPPGIENDDYDSEGDIRFLKELLSNDLPPLPENESSNLNHFNDPSSSRPSSKPPDVEIFI
ncbi:hypothetical protein Tco_1514569 [Tanacetum coccineum]